MKSKKMMALVTAAAMAFGLAGCGGGNTAATTAAPAEKAEEKTTAAEAVTEATEAAKSEGSDNWKVAILIRYCFTGRGRVPCSRKSISYIWSGAHRYSNLSGQLYVRDGDYRIPDRIFRI